MLNILDRYISRRFLFTLAFALVAFISIFIVVDLVENLDKFIDKKVPKPLIVSYYLYYLPFIIVLILPVAMLLASLFSIGQLARYNELTAMKSSGLSLYRLLSPLLILAFSISVITIFFSEKVVPLANQKKYEIKRVHIDKLPQHISTRRRGNIYLRDEKDRRVFIGYYDSQLKLAHKVSIQSYQGNFIESRIDAPRMIWRDGGWVLLDGYVRKFKPDGEVAEPFERMELSALHFLPEDLAKIQKNPEEMSYFELREFIQEVKKNGGDPHRWLVDLYLKLSFPFANFIIVLFGAPLSANKRRSGAVVGFGISLFICFIYFGIVKTGQTMGHNGTLPPMLAAWLGNIVFGLAGILILVKVRK